MEFPAGHAHLEDRACPYLWKYSGCKACRANSSHCSSCGIFNPRGEFPKSKYAQELRSPPLHYDGLIVYRKAPANGSCQMRTHQIWPPAEISRSQPKWTSAQMETRSQTQRLSVKVTLWSLLFLFPELNSWMQIHVEMAVSFFRKLKWTFVSNQH